MWRKISNLILRNRILILCILFLITAFMGLQSTKVQLQYQFNKLLPENDPTYLAYEKFKANFGIDGMMVVIATDEPDFYTENRFNAWLELADSLKNIKVNVSQTNIPRYKCVVDSIFSEAHLYNIVKDKSNSQFALKEIIDNYPLSQSEVDSVKKIIKNLEFYNNIVYKDSSDLHFMMLFLNKDIFNSNKRGTLIDDIRAKALSYSDYFSHLKFSGLPFIRSVMMTTINKELKVFIMLAMLVTALLLLLFFRSIKVVIISMVVVAIGVVWSLGVLSLFNYEITALTGLIPPLLIVIGIPNCVYLINKFQQEFKSHGKKIKALDKVIQKVGNATFLTNATTSMGFGTFVFTHSAIMKEFGVVASINIICMFIISICLVPIIFSYLPEPKGKHTQHLDRKWMFKLLDALVYFSTQKRKQVYLVTSLLIIVGIYGMSLMHTTGNISDDLPNDDLVVKDLKFFEEELNGVLPFEIILTFNNVVYDNFSNIAKIQQLQEQLKNEKYLSKSLSIVDAMKFISQSYANGKKSKYDLDFSKSKDQRYFSRVINSVYFKNTFSDSIIDNSNGFVKTFLDSNHTTTRITMQIADIGTAAMDSLISRINTYVDNIVNPEASQFKVVKNEEDIFNFYNSHNNIKYKVQDQLTTNEQDGIIEFPTELAELKQVFGLDVFESAVRSAVDQIKIDLQITGTGVMYAKGTTYLVNNLFISLLIAIIVVALLMSFLFRSLKMVLVSLLPNLLPLIFTSALMGYLGIPIKPSTILVFSIAFGISIDDTIHFLAKYRQELKHHSIRKSVETSIRETGVSMIYTSIILFFGFSIFTASNFGGTQALGLLVSLTLFVAMLTNLVLLPSLLLSLEKRILTQNFKESEDLFQDDQDIEWNKL